MGLVDGTVHVGALESFDPNGPEVVLRDDDSGEGRAIPCARVSYVALSGTPSAAPSAVGQARALRVHVARGGVFSVMPVGDPSDPLGFWAEPTNASSAYERIFFFAHGVNARERDESLGAMLLREGAIAEDDLAQGLDRQAQLHRRRIGEILLARKRIEPSALNEALSLQKRRRVRLGEVLVEAGLITQDDVEAALLEQRRHGGKRIGEILVEMGAISETTLAATLARKFHLAFVDLDECVIDPAAAHAVPRELIRKYRIVPIEADAETQAVTIAICDPLDTEPIDLVRFHCRGPVQEVVAVPSQIARYVEEVLLDGADPEGDVSRILDDLARQTDDEPEDEDGGHGVEVRETDSAIVQLANRVIVEAVHRGASDIHIEPNGGERSTQIRFRVDGSCDLFREVPATHFRALVSRLKIMADLDISERRKPQDGKIRLRLPRGKVELRVATIPTVSGEDVVLRVLSSSRPLPMDGLGLSPRDQKALEALVERPFGLLLCVGPTGSGKTTTLHSLLGHVNGPERKIWTAEDPVEITQPGLRQVQVRPKIGFGFAEALRAFLRADPDVVMIGEMRDQETARIAVEASLTGHLVLSTLHTNSAPETVTRLIEMGLDAFSFGDALLGVLAQRLTRQLCRCRQPDEDTDASALRELVGAEAAEELLSQGTWRPVGCEQCGGKGYRGRVAIHELLVVDDGLRAAIHRRADAATLRRLAREGGMRTLFEDGVAKCARGLTDLTQVLAVCSR